jgi:predicted nucleic acid-binding protein
VIVVDTNVIAYLFIQGEYTGFSEKLLKSDSQWIAPRLWRSEFRNILVQYLNHNYLEFEQAVQIFFIATELMRSNEYEVNSVKILELANNSNCSAYDCEFVALAEETQLTLVTSDKKIIKEFPDYTINLKDYSYGKTK